MINKVKLGDTHAQHANTQVRRGHQAVQQSLVIMRGRLGYPAVHPSLATAHLPQQHGHAGTACTRRASSGPEDDRGGGAAYPGVDDGQPAVDATLGNVGSMLKTHGILDGALGVIRETLAARTAPRRRAAPRGHCRLADSLVLRPTGAAAGATSLHSLERLDGAHCRGAEELLQPGATSRGYCTR